MGGTRTRKDKACMLVAVADEICKSKDSKITKYLFEPSPIEISTGPTKPGQIRTTRSSKLITRSEADMASVEGN